MSDFTDYRRVSLEGYRPDRRITDLVRTFQRGPNGEISEPDAVRLADAIGQRLDYNEARAMADLHVGAADLPLRATNGKVLSLTQLMLDEPQTYGQAVWRGMPYVARRSAEGARDGMVTGFAIGATAGIETGPGALVTGAAAAVPGTLIGTAVYGTCSFIEVLWNAGRN